jgi:hypothetical protein
VSRYVVEKVSPYVRLKLSVMERLSTTYKHAMSASL